MITLRSYQSYKTDPRHCTQFFVVQDILPWGNTLPGTIAAEFPSFLRKDWGEYWPNNSAQEYARELQRRCPPCTERMINLDKLIQGPCSRLGNKGVHHEQYSGEGFLEPRHPDWVPVEGTIGLYYAGKTWSGGTLMAIPFGTPMIRYRAWNNPRNPLVTVYLYWSTPNCIALSSVTYLDGVLHNYGWMHSACFDDTAYYGNTTSVDDFRPGLTPPEIGRELVDAQAEGFWETSFHLDFYNYRSKEVPWSPGSLSYTQWKVLPHLPGFALEDIDLDHWRDSLYGAMPGPTMTPEEKGELSKALAKSMKATDVNLWTLPSDIAHFGSELNTFRRFTDKSFSKILRRGADAELSFKYGSRLTVKDCTELISDLERRKDYTAGVRMKRHAVLTLDPQRVCRATAYFGSPENAVCNALYQAYSYGVLPGLTEAWDLVPYSFVCDWFVNISKGLNAIDTSVYGDLLPLEEIVYSLSRTSVNPLFVKGCVVATHSRSYDRWCESTFTVPPLSLAPDDFSNYVELTAIIIQRIIR